MTDNNNKDKKRENPSSQEGPSAEVTSDAAGATTTNVGDTDKKILDTGDVSRASIAKGIRGPDDGVTAADVLKGNTKPEDVISYTTGISAENGRVLNPNTDASITKELDRDIETTTTNNTEDVSKLVSSGTSSSKTGGIDKDNIYSSDDSTRHLEKVQETTTTTDKEDTNTES